MYKVLRNFLFLFDAELIHEFSVKFIKVFFNFPLTTKIIRRLFIVNHSSLEKKLFGLKFKNPVGLADAPQPNADIAAPAASSPAFVILSPVESLFIAVDISRSVFLAASTENNAPVFELIDGIYNLRLTSENVQSICQK